MNAVPVILVGLMYAGVVSAQGTRGPIIDMHLHAHELWTKPGELEPLSGLKAAQGTDDLRRRTLAVLRQFNIVKAVGGGSELARWVEEAPERLLPTYEAFLPDAPIDSLRAWVAAGRYAGLAELGPQYAGLAPTDSLLEPYFALAEELDLPVGIHMGLGPPGAAYRGFPKYRMSLGNPLLLEDVLIRHPRLRLWVMHAGWPMADETIGLLYAHPHVYVDLGVIDWVLPRAEFHRYLKRLVDAGYAKRIMFGSDQMVWPDAIGKAIANVQSAPFLSAGQKRDILYHNAARFLRVEREASDTQ